MDINNKAKEIKQSFRQMMDGATAQSMRDKGLNYHLNWGATLPRLREMADEIKLSVDTEDALYDLAIALWKENVRECKILATMLMPPEKMLSEVADIWMEQTPTVEVAEQSAFNLYQRLPYAAEKAFLWISLPDDLPQLCGYHILSRLFMRQQDLNERGINEFIDQALTALSSSSLSVQKAAFAALQHFADLSLMHRRLAESALRSHGFQL